MSKNTTDSQNLYKDFDNFLSQKEHQVKAISNGSIVDGVIVDIQPGFIIVDVGYKSEGIVAGREMKADDTDLSKLNVGDTMLVYVVKLEDDEGQMILSIRRTQQASAWIKLEKAKVDNDVVEATVVESNNGGVIVQIDGEVRGFIPTSQLDASRVYASGVRQVGKDISSKVQKRLVSLIGEKIKTRIIELDREKNKIILSEKHVTQARDLEKRENTLRKVKEGAALKGEVSGITPYGIFVNAQGLEGLVHLSELSWDKVEDISKLYAVGDKVDVMVIGLADGGKRVAYSVKRMQSDPWSKVISKYKIGDVVDGVVQKVVDYGAFVRIDEGLNGLIHISEMSDKLVKDPREILKEGQEVKVKILSISSTERHLGLSLKEANKSSKPAEVKEVNAEDMAKAVDKVIEEEIAG